MMHTTISRHSHAHNPRGISPGSVSVSCAAFNLRGTPSVRLLRNPASRHRHALRQYATNQDVNASRQYSKIRALSLLSGFSI
jgi:hypothetical protein